MSLLRGAGPRGASGMRARARFDGRLLVRPLLDVPREAIVAYARKHGLRWVEDESNAAEAYARNFIRLRIAPLLAARYPRWRQALARAARHFARADADAGLALREFLASRGLRAPSEANRRRGYPCPVNGGVPERSNGAVLKTAEGSRPP